MHTRSAGKGSKQSSAQNSSNEGTATTESAETSGTGTTAETSATETTAETSATGTAETSATETTAETSATGTTMATESSVAAQSATTEATGTTAKRVTKPTTVSPATEQPMRTTTGKEMPTEEASLANKDKHMDPNTHKRAGSTRTKTKALKIAKAREELARLQVELAMARLAALETMDTDDDEDNVSVDSKIEENNHARVDTWLQEQPAMLAITNEPHHRSDSQEPVIVTEPKEGGQPQQAQPMPTTPQAPAGALPDFAQLTAAITLAIKAGQRPKQIDLPIFNGSHQDWLTFYAAYTETEDMFSQLENINRLRKSLKGKAREAVESLLITNAHPSEVMKTLETRFGRPESIAMTEMDALRALPRLNESPRDICVFSTKVTNVVSTLRALKCVYYLYNPEVSKAMIDKLTPTLRYRYYDFAATKPKDEPNLLTFERFMKREAELCGPYAQPEPVTSHQPTQPRRQQKINTVTEKQSTGTAKCPVCQDTGHTTADCEKFQRADVSSRWDMAKDRRLCFRCLRFRNKTHHCKIKACDINGCRYYHHRMLHADKTENAESIKEEGSTEAINSAWTNKTQRKQSYLKIIPVQATGPRGTIETYALLDDGSTVTLINDRIADSIGAQGPIDPLRIEAINEMKTAENKSRRVTITLKGFNSREERIQARTVKNLHISPQKVLWEEVSRCRHLRDISEALSYENAKPQILIGQDNWHLLLSTKARKGGKHQPVASLTPLGWVLHGSCTRALGQNIDFVSHVTEMVPEDNLEDLVKRYFEMDALCINPKKPQSDPEERALRILEENTVHTKEGRYETALLWRNEEVILPDNYGNALKRLSNIEKRLDRDQQLKEKYSQEMEALITKGYAERAPKEKTENRTWYLPHFGVVNSMKPDKLRVVHDAAAKTRGVALNDLLLKGPDLLQSLPGVIMRFRQHMIAATADIKEMFMQIKLREQDRDALRYLWRKDRRDDKPPEEYRMTSLIFGASSSPSTAIYVKDLNAKKHEQSYPEAAAAIKKKHYVDDYLDSFKTLEDAVRICSDVQTIHKNACFELKQWKSNSSQLLETLGEKKTTHNIEIYKSEDSIERVLGLIWRTDTDEFTFNLNLTRIPPSFIEGKTPTKREALRIVMSLFDPLGFASPVTIKARQMLQEVWRRGTAWDDAIEEDLAEAWRSWIGHLKGLSNVAIPRRYLQYSDATTLQLHVFTDASESAYSAVVFWRATAPDGQIDVSLVIAKAKVAPLKLTSIPRLELQAAVMGTRLAAAVLEEHERKPESKTFWTDSKTVLTWIKTGARSYKPYVAHRIAAIEDNTTLKEWRWVPTKLNVADDATRDVPANFDKNHRWYKGPDFLREDESLWPMETVTIVSDEPSGEEKVHHIVTDRKPKLAEGLPEVSRFSNWQRLRYTAARVLQFIELCKATKERINYRRTTRNPNKDPDWKKQTKKAAPKPDSTLKNKTKCTRAYIALTAELLKRAEDLLMRSSQESCFPQEIEDAIRQKTPNKESRLYQLSVVYENNALRLRSRIKATSNVTDSFKSPMILDGDHPTVKLWIRAVHVKMHHAGVEATVNECRQQYWILRLRPTTRTVVRQCFYCRMKAQSPPSPRTGDLPPCRLAHHKRPFSFTGLDYFGPMTVTVGRTNQKRYGAIFTCLTTRAIHLELSNSLSTDSAIMALRRMIARRGCPTEIWSDNGTNLKGADKELRQARDKATAEEAAKRTISWRFIPPGAPFMGGAWERMVRSVKNALKATLHERRPTEEVLSTLLTEVEYTVNSRPLTHVSVSHEDPEALTPNHFLLGGPGNVTSPGTFDDKDTVGKSNWRATQRLADIFWSRWMREYLPELQNRREPHGRGPTIKLGDLVQVIDPNLPRNTWIRGRVTAAYPGPDDVVRTVDIATKGGILRRPVKKLVVLPIQSVVPAPEHTATPSHGGRNVQNDVKIA